MMQTIENILTLFFNKFYKFKKKVFINCIIRNINFRGCWGFRSPEPGTVNSRDDMAAGMAMFGPAASLQHHITAHRDR